MNRTKSACQLRSDTETRISVAYSPIHNNVAQSVRSWTVSIQSCSVGGTAGRSKILLNSRDRGAPVTTVFEPDWMVISAVCVGKAFDGLRRALVLVMGACPGSHFSILIVLMAGRIQISRTMFTFPPECSIHHLASECSRGSDSDIPASTRDGQSPLFDLIRRFFQEESLSFAEAFLPTYFVAPSP